MDRPTSQKADVTIHGLATDGRGAARVEGGVYFIPGALPGDKLRVQLDSETKPPSGEILEMIEPSPHRVEHPCPHAGVCTASSWGWLSYEQQLEHKRALVERTLRKTVGNVVVLPTVPSPKQWHYRNRLTLTVWSEGRRLRFGYQVAPRSYEGVPVRTCKLGVEALDTLLRSLSTRFEMADARLLDHLPRRMQLHVTKNGAGVMLVFAGRVTEPEVAAWTTHVRGLEIPGGVWFAQGTQAGIPATNRPIQKTKDADVMQGSWLGEPLEIHPAAFTQANSAAADLVHKRLQEYAHLETFDAIWDLYGGYGALGCALAGTGHPLNVIEISRHVKPTFEQLAKFTGTKQRKLFTGDLLTELPKHVDAITESDLVIFDPPRSGAHPDVLQMICASAVRRVIYLSCNPARLARDLNHMIEHRFVPHEIQPYDFFPQTPAIETLVILQR